MYCAINQSVVSLCYPELPRSYLSSVQILLDLSAAFNMVNHKTFLSVHTSLVIHLTAWWCASYLEGLSYQMTKSGPTGVPQDPVPLHPLSVRSHPLYLLSQWGYGFSYMAFYTTEDTQLMLSFPPSLMFLLGSHNFWQTPDHEWQLNLSKTKILYLWRWIPMWSSCDLPEVVSDHTICHCAQPWNSSGQPVILTASWY